MSQLLDELEEFINLNHWAHIDGDEVETHLLRNWITQKRIEIKERSGK